VSAKIGLRLLPDLALMRAIQLPSPGTDSGEGENGNDQWSGPGHSRIAEESI